MIKLKSILQESFSDEIQRGWLGLNGEVIWSKPGEYHKDIGIEYLKKIGKYNPQVNPNIQMMNFGWMRIAVLKWDNKIELCYQPPNGTIHKEMTRKQKSELKNLEIEFDADIVRDSCVTEVEDI